MKEQTIGVLGGLGPEATLQCYGNIIANTPAQKDQDHLRVIIDSNPKVPDRNAAIAGRGESPVPMLLEGCRALKRAGADFIIVPCVLAHLFLDEVQTQIELPILSVFDAVTEAIIRNHPAVTTVGLMGTIGMIEGGLFQKRLGEDGIKTVIPNDAAQNRVMAAIYDIKNSRPDRSREEISADLVEAAQSLVNRGPDAAQAIIAGCTEIPLALKQEHLPVPYLDSLNILARAAIRRAGRTPISLA
jgi:aspartate racemase